MDGWKRWYAVVVDDDDDDDDKCVSVVVVVVVVIDDGCCDCCNGNGVVARCILSHSFICSLLVTNASCTSAEDGKEDTS